MRARSDPPEPYKRMCRCGHTRSSHYAEAASVTSLTKGKEKTDVRTIYHSCLAFGCPCTIYREVE